MNLCEHHACRGLGQIEAVSECESCGKTFCASHVKLAPHVDGKVWLVCQECRDDGDFIV